MPENYRTFVNEGEELPSKYYVYRVATIAAIGSLLFGYNTGIMSGSLPLIESHFDLSIFWKEGIVAGGIAGAAFFAVFAGYACDKYGRKVVIMTAAVAFMLGAGVSGAAISKEMLLVGRIIVGLAMGFASTAVPVYLAETAPAPIRGRLVTLSPLFMTLGIVVSGISAAAFNEIQDIGWRYMYFLPMVPAFIQFISFLFLPESPRWLVSKRKILRARRVLQNTNLTTNVEIELSDIDSSSYEAKNRPGSVIGNIVRTPHVRKALMLGVSLHIVTSLSGINSVSYNSGTILQMGGLPPEEAIWLVSVPNIINFLAMLIAVLLVEKVGRKKLIMSSLIGVTIAAMILAIGFQLSFKFSPEIDPSVNETTHGGGPLKDGCYDVGFSNCESCVERDHCGFCFKGTGLSGSCLRSDPTAEDLAAMFGRCTRTEMAALRTRWSYSYCPTEYNFIAVLGMFWFLLCFAPGLGPMTWVITSEIYPLWARTTCFAIGTGVNWACYLLVTISFLTIFQGISYGAFWVFAGVCLIGVFISVKFVPETKEKTLEEMEQLFGAGEKPPRNELPEQAAKKDVFGGPVTF